MRTSEVKNISWQVFMLAGLMAQMVVSILFFYPLYTNFVTREPVQILFLQFHEPLEFVLLIEMGLCVLAFIIAATLMFFYSYKMRKAPI